MASISLLSILAGVESSISRPLRLVSSRICSLNDERKFLLVSVSMPLKSKWRTGKGSKE